MYQGVVTNSPQDRSQGSQRRGCGGLGRGRTIQCFVEDSGPTGRDAEGF